MNSEVMELAEGEDPMANAAVDVVDVPALLEEFDRCTTTERTAGVIDMADRVTYAQWAGQHESGKKWDEHMPAGKEAFPWNGASDTRIRLADEIIGDNVTVLLAAFMGARFSAEASQLQNIAASSAATKRMDWARANAQDLLAEVEYAAEWSQRYGWCVLHNTWLRELAKRYEEVTVEELQKLSAMPEGNGADGTNVLPSEARDLLAILETPGGESVAVGLVQALYKKFVRMQSRALKDEEIPDLDGKQAREVVKSFMDYGSARVPVPYVKFDGPSIRALQPGVEIFFPAETCEIQSARVIFCVGYLTAAQLDAKRLEEKWDPAWVDAVKLKAGDVEAVPVTDTVQISSEAESAVVMDRANLCQVVWAYRLGVDDNGVRQITFTIVSPHVKDKCALHELLDCGGEYPFTSVRREKKQRRLIASRGVPEIVFTWQEEMKAQRDGLFDRTSLSVLPPLKKPKGRGKVVKLGPGVTVEEDRADSITWMQPPPGHPAESLVLLDHLAATTDNYFGRHSKNVDPTKSTVKQQKMVSTFLSELLESFKQIDAMMEQYLEDEELMKISGEPAETRIPEERSRYSSWKMVFDVNMLNTDFMLKRMDIMSKTVLPEDRAGVIDMAKWVKWKAMVIDPAMAREVITSETPASQKLFDGVQNDLALIGQGFEPQYVENDPTAKRKLEYAEAIVGKNMKLQQLSQQDKEVKLLLEKYFKNLHFSVTQEENKTRGRIGV